ncbi:MAG: cyclase family protein [Christensenellaceae bacterium]|nr:cyclase family protein [Christensenellaceae bacterium]
MTIYDATKELLSAEAYPDAKENTLTRLMDMKSGELYNYSELTINMHAGTHIDAPLHFINDGRNIAEMPLECFYGECLLISAPKCVTKEFLEENLPKDTKRLLLKTGGKGYLEKEAAEYLAQTELLTIGIDAISVGTLQTEMAVHVPLLKKGIAIIEAMKLDHIPDGKYILSAMPLKVDGAEASPVRAVLIEK